MKNIWILDDDKSIRWVFEKALEKENLPFKTFSNTNEAINQFNHEKPQPNLVDNQMILQYVMYLGSGDHAGHDH